MELRIAIAVLVLAAGAAAADAQRPHRVGYLQTASEEEQRRLTRAFENAMRELGYIAFVRMRDASAEALWAPPDPLTFTARRQVVTLAERHRRPAVYWQREFVDIGGLVSYGSNLSQQFRRAAWYVDRILKGAPPGELAMEQASKFEIVVNRKSARDLGIALPQSVLLRADAVVP